MPDSDNQLPQPLIPEDESTPAAVEGDESQHPPIKWRKRIPTLNDMPAVPVQIEQTAPAAAPAVAGPSGDQQEPADVYEELSSESLQEEPESIEAIVTDNPVTEPGAQIEATPARDSDPETIEPVEEAEEPAGAPEPQAQALDGAVATAAPIETVEPIDADEVHDDDAEMRDSSESIEPIEPEEHIEAVEPMERVEQVKAAVASVASVASVAAVASEVADAAVRQPSTSRPTPPPPAGPRRPESVPPPPPAVKDVKDAVQPVISEVRAESEHVVVQIPEDQVQRDYRVAVEREALEAAAIEVIPPEFMTEAGATPPPPPRPRRQAKPKRWYEEIFGEDYLMALPKLSAFQLRREIDFVEKNLGLAPGAMVLDLGCGPGIHAIGMAKRGYQVVGLDLSVGMLAIAGEDAQKQEAKINLLHGDMRDLQFGPTFDGVYCVGSSFGYFNEENNAKVLAGVHKALKPSGVFLLEVDNRDYAMRGQPSLLWFEGDGFIGMEETSFDFITSRLDVKRTLLIDGGGKRTFNYNLRLYSLHELGTMLHNAGFGVHSIGGHRAASKAFMGEESPRIIIASTKKAEEG